jgi:hypothetical protein
MTSGADEAAARPWRYADVVCDPALRRFLAGSEAFTVAEAESLSLIQRGASEVASEHFGRTLSPVAALLCAIYPFRLMMRLCDILSPSALNVVEIAPGGGYLPLLLIDHGCRYAGIEPTRAAAEWQSRLWQGLAGETRADWPAGTMPSAWRDAALHQPEWSRTLAEAWTLPADIVICNPPLHALDDAMLGDFLEIARRALKRSRLGLLLCNDWKRDGSVGDRARLRAAFGRFGFRQAVARGPVLGFRPCEVPHTGTLHDLLTPPPRDRSDTVRLTAAQFLATVGATDHGWLLDADTVLLAKLR